MLDEDGEDGGMDDTFFPGSDDELGFLEEEEEGEEEQEEEDLEEDETACHTCQTCSHHTIAIHT